MKTREIALYGIFTAIIIILALTSLGFITIGVVSVTIIPMVVGIGSVFLGPTGGAVLGLVFGLASLARCFGMEAFGTALMGINPFLTTVTCLVPRILMGWLCGVIYKLSSKKIKNNLIPLGITNLSAALLNSVFFVGLFFLFFWNTEYVQSFGNSVWEIFLAFFLVNILAELAVITVIGTTISKTLQVFLNKGRDAK